MSVVLLSSDSFCRSDEIASQVARDLGYDLVGSEIEATAAATYDVPVEKLRQALITSPSFPAGLSRSRKRNVAYYQAAFLSTLSRGDVLYCGEIGHVLVSGVSHVLKVKLTADLEDRVARCLEQHGQSERRARNLLLKEATQRKRWFIDILGADGTHPSEFDLVVNLTQSGFDGACEVITKTAREVRFHPITYSVKALRNNEVASRVRATLIKDYPDVGVSARDGEVRIRSKPLAKDKRNRASSIRDLVLDMEGVTYVMFE